MENKRIAFLDFMKGIAALMVVLVHLPNTPTIYDTIISFIMIPGFFFASGYLVRLPQKHIFRDFLYKRVGKLFVLYSVYMLLLPFANVSELKSIIQNPTLILMKIKASVAGIFLGKDFWFVSCLIVINLIFVVLKLLSRDSKSKLFVLSVIVCVSGLVIAEREMLPWNFDTALVCQLIYVLGFLTKESKIMDKITRLKTTCAVAVGLFFAVALGGIGFFGAEIVKMNFVLNDWGVWFVSIPAIVFGVASIVLIGQLINGVKIIDYIGAHSLVYFAFAGHSASIIDKAFGKLAIATDISVFSDRYVINPISCVIGCLLMIIPCLLIDKFIPFLNGRFNMPLPDKTTK